MLTFEPPVSEMLAGMVYASPFIKRSFDCLAEIRLHYRIKLVKSKYYGIGILYLWFS